MFLFTISNFSVFSDSTPDANCIDFNYFPSKHKVALSQLPERHSSNSFDQAVRNYSNYQNNSACNIANDRIVLDRFITGQF